MLYNKDLFRSFIHNFDSVIFNYLYLVGGIFPVTLQLVGLPDPYLRGLEVRSTYLDIVDLWLPIATVFVAPLHVRTSEYFIGRFRTVQPASSMLNTKNPPRNLDGNTCSPVPIIMSQQGLMIKLREVKGNCYIR